MLTIFGLGMFCFFFFGVQRAQAYRWRYLSRAYAKPVNDTAETRKMQSAVLVGLGGFNSLKGILTVGAHATGVSFRVMAPFALFHSPLFVPYSEIRGWKTSWYLDAPSTELEFARAPGVKMILPEEQAKWIAGVAGHKMQLRDVDPPNGRAGRGWHIFSVAYAGLSLVMLAVLLVVYLRAA